MLQRSMLVLPQRPAWVSEAGHLSRRVASSEVARAVPDPTGKDDRSAGVSGTGGSTPPVGSTSQKHQTPPPEGSGVGASGGIAYPQVGWRWSLADQSDYSAFWDVSTCPSYLHRDVPPSGHRLALPRQLTEPLLRSLALSRAGRLVPSHPVTPVRITSRQCSRARAVFATIHSQ